MTLSKKIFIILSALPVVLALVLFLSEPVKYAICVSEGVSLWAVSVLPSVFPFLFLTGILSKTRFFNAFSRRISPLCRRIFRISGTGGGIFLLSVLSGYPVGARTVANCYEQHILEKDELFRLACLASTSGPVFLVGVVGAGMLSNTAIGWLMLACHLIAVMLVSFILSLRAPKIRKTPMAMKQKSGALLFDGIYSSVISVLCVGGSIALFACFSQMTADLLRLPETGILTAVVRGLFEMTTGCSLLCRTPDRLALSLCCFFVTFGGLCVLFQQLAFLSRAGVKSLPFVLVKLLQGVLAGVLFYLVSLAAF